MKTVDSSYYDVLGVSSSATCDEIKTAYRSAIRKHHPDVSDAPDAQHLTERLNDAYAVLSDARSRWRYDASTAAEAADVEDVAETHWTLYSCDCCGRIDARLRYAVFYRVWSLAIYTHAAAEAAVLCGRCRGRLAMRTLLFSMVLGPWGLPWGIPCTLRALFASIRGGELPRRENAELLRHQGLAYLQHRLLSEARTALAAAQRFQRSASVSMLLTDVEVFGV